MRCNSLNYNIFVSERYCVNPNCNCMEIVLEFDEISDDGEVLNELFMIRLDIHSWKVTEKRIYNKNIKADSLVDEFIENIDTLKGKLLSHYNKAKEYGRKHYLEYIPEDVIKLILDGKMIGYSEVFGNQDTDKFSFEFQDTEKYFIDDQYCSNPKCPCNEAVLAFFRINNSRPAQEPEFIVRISLKKFKYEIEKINCSVDKVSAIMTHVQYSMPEFLDTLKKRYNDIKSTAKEIIKKHNSEVMNEEQQKVKVGRNDPCPCGSGKKYKKCCGQNCD